MSGNEGEGAALVPDNNGQVSEMSISLKKCKKVNFLNCLPSFFFSYQMSLFHLVSHKKFTLTT